jgi:transposase
MADVDTWIASWSSWERQAAEGILAREMTNFRHDIPLCPQCGEPADRYEVMWDYHWCGNDHRWDGPNNGGPEPSHHQKRV